MALNSSGYAWAKTPQHRATSALDLMQLIKDGESLAFTMDPSVTPMCEVKDGALVIAVGERTFRLVDQVHNTDAPSAADQEMACETLANCIGTFDAFVHAKVRVVLDGDHARMERVTCELVHCQDKKPMPSVILHYDVVIFKQTNLIQIFATFDCAKPTRLSSFNFLKLELNENYDRWMGGFVPMCGGMDDEDTFESRSFDHYGGFAGDDCVAIIGSQVTLAKPDHYTLCADIGSLNIDVTEFGAEYPLSACIVYGQDVQPTHMTSPQLRVVAPTECDYSLSAGRFVARFARHSNGICVSQLLDGEKTLFTGANLPLFSAMFRDISTGEQFRLDSLNGFSTQVIPSPNRLTFVFDRQMATVILTATADPAVSRITWDMNIHAHLDHLTLLEAQYPRMAYALGEDATAFSPAGSGEVVENVGNAAFCVYMPYSSAFASMQYMAAYAGGVGLYYGIHDPMPSKKSLFCLKTGVSGIGQMMATYQAEGIGEAKNGQKLPGQAIWQLYDGDWYDAAQIYRQWVLNSALWSPAAGRPDVTKWFVETPMWFNVAVGAFDGKSINNGWDQQLVTAAKELGVPVAAHIYNWHQIPFDNDYPHYFPAKEDFVQKVPMLKEHGIKIMPYINSRLWDTHDRGNEDWMFSKLAKASATKNLYGNVITEQYGSVEQDGSLVHSAVMCPGSALWQETQQEICRKLFDEIGVDGVYLDQIAAQFQPLCMDKTHNHRPGGGSWWAQGYYNFMEHLNRVKPEGCIYTTECNAEIYARHLDGYLSWHWARAGQVPAFSAVYAGYIPMFGRCYNQCDTKFRILLAQSLMDGEQLGWLSPEMYLNSPYKDLYTQCVRARWEYTAFFHAGRMLRPPKIETQLAPLTTLKAFAGIRAISSPAVLGCKWAKNGETLMMFINIAKEDANARIILDVDQAVFHLQGGASGSMTIVDGEMNLTISALSLVVGQLAISTDKNQEGISC